MLLGFIFAESNTARMHDADDKRDAQEYAASQKAWTEQHESDNQVKLENDQEAIAQANDNTQAAIAATQARAAEDDETIEATESGVSGAVTTIANTVGTFKKADAEEIVAKDQERAAVDSDKTEVVSSVLKGIDDLKEDNTQLKLSKERDKLESHEIDEKDKDSLQENRMMNNTERMKAMEDDTTALKETEIKADLNVAGNKDANKDMEKDLAKINSQNITLGSFNTVTTENNTVAENHAVKEAHHNKGHHKKHHKSWLDHFMFWK